MVSFCSSSFLVGCETKRCSTTRNNCHNKLLSQPPKQTSTTKLPLHTESCVCHLCNILTFFTAKDISINSLSLLFHNIDVDVLYTYNCRVFPFTPIAINHSFKKMARMHLAREPRSQQREATGQERTSNSRNQQRASGSKQASNCTVTEPSMMNTGRDHQLLAPRSTVSAAQKSTAQRTSREVGGLTNQFRCAVRWAPVPCFVSPTLSWSSHGDLYVRQCKISEECRAMLFPFSSMHSHCRVVNLSMVIHTPTCR